MGKTSKPPPRKRQKAEDAEAAEQQKEVTAADLPATAAAAFVLGAMLHLPKT